MSVDGKAEEASKLREKVQQRVQVLLTAKAEIKADTMAKLVQAGIEMTAADKTEEATDEGDADTTSPEATPAE